MLSKSTKDVIIQFPIGEFKARNPKELQFSIEVLVYNYIEQRLYQIDSTAYPQDQHAIYMKVVGVLDTVKHKLQEGKVLPFEKQSEFEADIRGE